MLIFSIPVEYFGEADISLHEFIRYSPLISWGPAFHKTLFIIEPRHEISNNVVYATSKDSDQPAHLCSLVRAFASRFNIL